MHYNEIINRYKHDKGLVDRCNETLNRYGRIVDRYSEIIDPYNGVVHRYNERLVR